MPATGVLSMPTLPLITSVDTGWLVCEDLSCGTRTRSMPIKCSRSGPICSHCERATLHPEYTHYQLYNQLRFYQNIFDVRKQMDSMNDVEKSIARRSCDQYAICYRLLKKTIDQTLKSSAYSIINLTDLFGGFMDMKM
ncbi:DNA polymerase alpha catalytic subunit [Nymphon striatum]|nr:DNA polymerase alpha catalytic subunit [Nymphon striatum]